MLNIFIKQSMHFIGSLNSSVVVQLLSHVWHFVTPRSAACQASLSFTISRTCLTYVQWVGEAIQPSYPLSSPSPAFSLSQHQGLF